MRRALSGVIVGAALLAAATPARAQYPGAPQQVSPYLNLARGGSPAINYYGLIRPQQQLQSNLQQVQAALIDEQRFAGPQEMLATQAVVTGNYANYMTQGRYFMTRGGPAFGQRTTGYGGGYGTPGMMSPGAGPGGFGNQPAGLPTMRPSARR